MPQEYSEALNEEKEEFLRTCHFSKKELKNPITKASFIEKLIQFHQRESPVLLIPAEML